MTIGVFDSGMGGMTILRELIRFNPGHEYVYLGDNARAPYGDRSPERICEFTTQGVRFLQSQGASMIVLACNSASAQARDFLIHEGVVEEAAVIDVILPTVRYIATTRYQSIGVIGTRATVASHAYRNRILADSPGRIVQEQACPLFVPLIEEQVTHTRAASLLVRSALAPFRRTPCDALVLGCTHYPLITPLIKKHLAQRTAIVHPGIAVGRELAARTPSPSDSPVAITWYTTDDAARFEKKAHLFWGAPLVAHHVSIDVLDSAA